MQNPWVAAALMAAVMASGCTVPGFSQDADEYEPGQEVLLKHAIERSGTRSSRPGLPGALEVSVRLTVTSLDCTAVTGTTVVCESNATAFAYSSSQHFDHVWAAGFEFVDQQVNFTCGQKARGAGCGTGRSLSGSVLVTLDDPAGAIKGKVRATAQATLLGHPMGNADAERDITLTFRVAKPGETGFAYGSLIKARLE